MPNLNRFKFISICGLLCLIGCATATPVIVPSGQIGYSIDCNGTAVSMNVCYEKAGQVCPNGYILITQNESSGMIVMPTKPYNRIPTSQKGIIVECR